MQRFLLKRAEERKALDRSSHIRHTSTVFTLFIRGQDCRKEGRKESSEGKKDIKVSVGKNLQKVLEMKGCRRKEGKKEWRNDI